MANHRKYEFSWQRMVDPVAYSRQRGKVWREGQRERGLCRACNKPAASNRRSCDYHLKQRNDSCRRIRMRKRQQVFDAYGNKCACCEERNERFLTIDHVDGNSKPDRRKNSRFRVNSTAMAKKIIRLGFPPQYQLLCWNCNLAKHIYGTCPHKWSSIECDAHREDFSIRPQRPFGRLIA